MGINVHEQETGIILLAQMGSIIRLKTRFLNDKLRVTSLGIRKKRVF